MMRAQMSLEIAIIYGLAVVAIILAVSLVLTFFPTFSQASTSATYSGLQGFDVIAIGYYAPSSIFYMKVQNLLNENVKIDAVSLIIGSQNYTGCGGGYLQTLAYYECNITYTATSHFSGLVYIYYNPICLASWHAWPWVS